MNRSVLISICCLFAMFSCGKLNTPDDPVVPEPQPEEPVFADSDTIRFEDSRIEALCLYLWDTDKDGVLTHGEARVSTSVASMYKEFSNAGQFFNYFEDTAGMPFNEFQHFTNVTELSASAFSGFQISEITLPKSVKNIGANCFLNCKYLKKIILPDGVETIGKSAFSGAIVLTEIELPDNFEVLSEKLFFNCKALKHFVVPSKVKKIEKEVFYASGLEVLDFAGDKIEAIATNAIDGAYLKELSGPIVDSDGGTLVSRDGNLIKFCMMPFIQKNGLIDQYMVDYAMPNSVKTINDKYCFYGGRFLSFSLSNSIETLPLGALSGVHSDKFSGKFATTDGRAIVVGDNLMVAARNDSGDYTLPKCKTIDNAAFMTSSFSSITLPEGLETIGDNAFEYCTATISSIPSSVRSFGRNCFCMCSNIKSIVVPDGVTEIPDSFAAFCPLPDGAFVPSSVKSIGSVAFDHAAFVVLDMTEVPTMPDLIVFGEKTIVYVPDAALEKFKAARPDVIFQAMSTMPRA